jgi:hypothetical protein
VVLRCKHMSANHRLQSKPCAAPGPLLSMTALARFDRLQRLLTATLEEQSARRAGGQLRRLPDRMRKFVAFLGLLGVIYALALQHGAFDHAVAPTESAVAANAELSHSCDENSLAAAYRDHRSRIEACGHGLITRVLKDDTEGSRHQRLIVRLSTGQTLLVAYNYDLAPRIEGLKPGSPIEFEGEYEWNPQGGVLHWTHRDPAGQHPSGWVRYGGRLYQ